MTTVFVGAVTAAAVGAQSVVGKDAPVAFNVRPDLLCEVFAVMATVIIVVVGVAVFVAVSAVVTTAAILTPSNPNSSCRIDKNMTAQKHPILSSFPRRGVYRGKSRLRTEVAER